MDKLRRASARLPSGSFVPDDPDQPVMSRRIRDAAAGDEAATGEEAGDSADEAAAGEARQRYQSEGMVSLGPDAAIAPLLAQGERVLAIRRCVGFERRPAPYGRAYAGRADLYLTSTRLVLIGHRTSAVDLDTIDEVLRCGGRLLLVLHEGGGLALEVERPLLLRVEIAAARAAARS